MGTSAEERMTQMEQEIESTRARLARDTDELGDKLSPQQIVQRRKTAAKSRVATMRDRVMGAGNSAAESVAGTTSDVTGATGDRMQGAGDRVEHATTGNPWAAGLVAFGAGMVIAAMFPASEKEKRVGQVVVETGQERMQPVLDEAASVGHDVVDTLKDKTSEAASDVTSSAQDAAATVKDEARSSAQDVQDQARS
jgi:ElaB/YqjD/DUF883 family membrane-anchored ribosome-binding protein